VFIYQNVCLFLSLYIHIYLYFTRQCGDIYGVVRYIIITLLQIVHRVCQ